MNLLKAQYPPYPEVAPYRYRGIDMRVAKGVLKPPVFGKPVVRGHRSKPNGITIGINYRLSPKRDSSINRIRIWSNRRITSGIIYTSPIRVLGLSVELGVVRNDLRGIVRIAEHHLHTLKVHRQAFKTVLCGGCAYLHTYHGSGDADAPSPVAWAVAVARIAGGK